MIYRFSELGSSNDEAQAARYSHGDVVVAERQTAGRGQRGNKWLSGEGLNLTLSLVLCPQGLELRRQFLLSQAVALGICDMLGSYGLDARIKWTNDIYIGDRKIVGILIENKLCGGSLVRSVVGIGLNINQQEFDAALPNPTSMTLEAGRAFERDEVLERLVAAILARFDAVGSEGEASLVADYHALMYRLGELHPFKIASGELLGGVIRGVEPSGELLIDWESGASGSYLFGGVEFVIEGRER